jgi:hypothetical protein
MSLGDLTVGSQAQPKLPSFWIKPCSSIFSNRSTCGHVAAPPKVTFADHRLNAIGNPLEKKIQLTPRPRISRVRFY